MSRDWSNLPKDLLGTILKHLTFIHDYIRFSAVCKSWHSIASENVHHLPRQLPFLMIYLHEENTSSRGTYSLLDRRILPIRLPVPHEKRCRGSADGWLTTIDADLSMSLFNPFSKKEIQLPPMTAVPNPYRDVLCCDSFIQKAVLSSNPSFSPDYLVMLIYSSRGELAFFRPGGGDVGWTAVECQHRLFDDVLHYRGQFYAINCSGSVVVFDPDGPNPSAVELAANPIPKANLIKRYLVESLGELLQVVRGFFWEEGNDDEVDMYRTSDFEVFKLDRSGPGSWIEVKSLGDRVLFLGDNTSFSLSASDFPGCRGNHIYFTDDLFERYVPSQEGSYDLGVFNLEDGRIEPFIYPIDDSVMPPPIWISPTLC